MYILRSKSKHEIIHDYQAKLIMKDQSKTVIAVLMTLSSEWLDEESGVRYWPVTLHPDIYSFIAFHLNELSSEDVGDYKTSRAYSYYAQGWMMQVHN